MREFTDRHIENLSKGQQNRKLNRNNTTGHKGIHPHKKGGYEVKVGGTYVGYRKSLDDAIVIRDEARARLFEYATD